MTILARFYLVTIFRFFFLEFVLELFWMPLVCFFIHMNFFERIKKNAYKILWFVCSDQIQISLEDYNMGKHILVYIYWYILFRHTTALYFPYGSLNYTAVKFLWFLGLIFASVEVMLGWQCWRLADSRPRTTWVLTFPLKQLSTS